MKLLSVRIGPFNLSSVRKGGALTHFSPKRNRFTRAPLIDRLLADSITSGYRLCDYDPVQLQLCASKEQRRLMEKKWSYPAIIDRHGSQLT